jgi:hypothetical protein
MLICEMDAAAYGPDMRMKSGTEKAPMIRDMGGPPQRWRRLIWFVLAANGVLNAAALVAVPAFASTGKAPVIESTSWALGGQITVEAQINPEGLAATYEIGLACGACGPPGYSPSVGVLRPVNEVLTVSLNLTGIKPGTYKFYVHARNSAGEASWSSQFEVPTVPPGACPEWCSTSELPQPELTQGTAESAER